MISFKKFILENANQKKSLEELKKYSSMLSDKYRDHYNQQIDVLSKALDDRIIYNARYGEASKGLLNMINRVYNIIEKTLVSFRQENKEASEKLPFSLYTASDIKKANKDVPQIRNLPSHAKQFFDAIRDVPDILKVIKGYVIKGREPKPADPSKPPAFVKPITSMEASRKAIQFMKDASASFEKELRESITKDIQKAYEGIKNATLVSDLPKDQMSKIVASTIFIIRPRQGKKFLEKHSDYEKRLNKLIDNNVRDIIEGFIAKSSTKLALILEKKGSPRSHSILRTNIRNGMVENSMKFEFEDKSSFTLESSVVYKYSQTGKLFFQYPTRFKNVRLPDGSTMKMPSEKKMIEEF